MKARIKEKTALLLISDSVAMSFAFVIALLLGHQAPFRLELLVQHLDGFLSFMLVSILIFFIADCYSLRKISGSFLEKALVVGFCLVLSSGIWTVIFFFFRDPVPRAVYIIFTGSTFLLVLHFRRIIARSILSSHRWRVLVVGNGTRSVEVARIITISAYLQAEPIGYVSGGDGSLSYNRLPRLGPIEDLVAIARAEGVDEVIAADPSESEDLAGLLVECMRHRIKVSEFRRVIEEITGRVPVDHLNDKWFLHELAPCSQL
jgi:FlaA1/EpsC-like NDP-sugar epimerase